ncbi:MAG: ribosome biogenesis GTPase Der [Candidatus Absconditicoccaceae bacterium]
MNIGLVGATNVGKSTLFNRLIGQFRAIVTDIPGTTRDIIQHKFNLEGVGDIIFSDSPGLLDFQDERIFIKKIINKSDLILFVIDDSVGITSKEQHIFSYIMDSGKKNNTILVINKLDIKRKHNQKDLALLDYYDLGFTNVIGISAQKGDNVDYLQEQIVDYVKNNKTQHLYHEDKNQSIPIAILGKPNSGKSTFLNTLVGEELSKVDEEAGTTRDYIVSDFTYKKQSYTVYDTAGIRKRGKIHGIERIANDKTYKMLEYVRPVVVFLVDVTEGITHRDMTILEEIGNLALPTIFCLNKVDLIDFKKIKNEISKSLVSLDFAKYIPILPLVAKTGEHKDEVFSKVNLLYKEASKRIETNVLNKLISTEYITRPPRFPKNKICKILYITQVDINAPTFLVFVNHKSRANFAFKKWIDNSIRKHFEFTGVPLVIRFKERSQKEED